MIEPVYVAQTGESKTQDEAREWLIARADEGRAEGAVFFRATIHPDIPDLILIEGWDTKFPRDQGDPRWQLVADK